MTLFVRRRDAWLAEDVDEYLACFTDDVVVEVPGRETVHGIVDYASLVRRSLEALRPTSFEFHELAVAGDTVLAEWTITLTVRGDGRTIAYRGMSSCRLRGDRIARWREYYDPAELKPR
jgi:ketosteroid isomerase-like protein